MTAAQSPLRPVEHVVDMYFQVATSWIEACQSWTKMWLRTPVVNPAQQIAELASTNGAVNGQVVERESTNA
jgi:hypothetical protein